MGRQIQISFCWAHARKIFISQFRIVRIGIDPAMNTTLLLSLGHTGYDEIRKMYPGKMARFEKAFVPHSAIDASAK
jgi:hypothetical protein